MALNLLFTIIAPIQSFALTGGPSQPEFASFTPMGASDMVDLSSGDMSYNIPLMDVGGYPLNLAYSSGIGMDDEASWVGLGWNLSVGQINRNVRGLPDDFLGDQMKYENYLKPNVTIGAGFKFNPALTGIVKSDFVPVEGGPQPGDTTSISSPITVGLSAMYNNYTGFSMKPSIGVSLDMAGVVSVGFNVESTPEGLSISPSLSINGKWKGKENTNNNLGVSVGCSFNSRSGLSAMTIGASKSRTAQKMTNLSMEKARSLGSANIGSSISLAEQLYTPSKRVGMSTGSFTVNVAGGTEIFGVEGQGQVTAYGTVTKVQESEQSKSVGAYGYINTDKAQNQSILDFNREKDQSLSINSNNMALTNYTYDIYSVQGHGVGGMFRPYRNQVGYVYDGLVADFSTSGSLGVEIGAGNAAHLGIDFDVTTVNSYSGIWEDNNYILQHLKENYNYNPDYEKVHYKNVGDLSVDRDFGMFNSIGAYQPVQIPFQGSNYNRELAAVYRKKLGLGGASNMSVSSNIKRTKRQLTNQAIYKLTIADLISGKGYGPIKSMANVTSQAKPHHIGEIQVIRDDGARYIYGQPLYNLEKVEATFAVDQPANCLTGLVPYSSNHVDNPKNLPNDKYLSRITTPAYVHTHLISSILSTDYQDRSNNGPTSDDFGSYTKFEYQNPGGIYHWRIPYEMNRATYNEGLKTDKDDDQGNYIYGKKEQKYIRKIETKTHVAIFSVSERRDAHGVNSTNGQVGSISNTNTDSKMYKLDEVALYSVGDYYTASGSVNTNAIPIKKVHFKYSYSLCKGVPNNDLIGPNNAGGKLTLKEVYFTYRNSKMGKYTGYDFDYNETSSTHNPNYNIKGYDSWGNYKPNENPCNNTAPVNPSEFPYTDQLKSIQDARSSTWNLVKIDLPSGGEISVNYESDDYAYVQDKKAQRMFSVDGAGSSANVVTGNIGLSGTGLLYTSGMPRTHFSYLYVRVDDDALITNNASSLYKEYIESYKDLIQFRFLLNMTKQGGSGGDADQTKFDYVSGYCEFDSGRKTDLKIELASGKKYLVLPVKMVDKNDGNDTNINPIAKAGWQFGRKYLSKYAYGNVNDDGEVGILEMAKKLVTGQIINNLVQTFKGPNGTLQSRDIARRFIRGKSWVRLGAEKTLASDNSKYSKKLGGGSRVNNVKMSDVWQEMTLGQGNYQTMNYGQKYNYTLKGDNGKSSGVATFEPIGNKENPLVQPVFSHKKLLLAPDEDNFTEMPFGESFFPSPQITYSRVEVSSIEGGINPNSGLKIKDLHKTGKVVTEFYTSKDYPVIVDQTEMQVEEDKNPTLGSLLNLYSRKHFTASQGYVIHLNDMNGKQKAQWVYAEDQNSPISGVEYKYDNNVSSTSASDGNKGKLNNLVTVINPNGSIQNKYLGVEYDIVNDFRENMTTTETAGLNTNLATFIAGIIPILVPIPLPDYSHTEEKVNMVGTTKVINTFGIIKETIAHDGNTSVSTRNLAWDANTGQVLLTQTVDEFNENIFSLNYPAHWHYEGMGQASQNIGLKGTLSGSGAAASAIGIGNLSNYFIQGDELLINTASGTTKGWISELLGSTMKIIDVNGSYLSTFNSSSSFEIVRSGHRNIQSAGIMNVSLQHNPLLSNTGSQLSSLSSSYLMSANWQDYRIIAAGAVDYSDSWAVDCECGIDLTENHNPYIYNEKGVWRVKSSRTYLTGRNNNAEVTPRRDGFYTSFAPMYRNQNGHWLKNFAGWTFVAEVTKYSPYGFELENRDALFRYSAARYGYNHSFPVAVGANLRNREIAYDGFEDYIFAGCTTNAPFNFQNVLTSTSVVSLKYAHTGKRSLKIGGNSSITLEKIIDCIPIEPNPSGGTGTVPNQADFQEQ